MVYDVVCHVTIDTGQRHKLLFGGTVHVELVGAAHVEWHHLIILEVEHRTEVATVQAFRLWCACVVFVTHVWVVIARQTEAMNDTHQDMRYHMPCCHSDGVVANRCRLHVWRMAQMEHAAGSGHVYKTETFGVSMHEHRTSPQTLPQGFTPQKINRRTLFFLFFISEKGKSLTQTSGTKKRAVIIAVIICYQLINY